MKLRSPIGFSHLWCFSFLTLMVYGLDHSCWLNGCNYRGLDIKRTNFVEVACRQGTLANNWELAIYRPVNGRLYDLQNLGSTAASAVSQAAGVDMWPSSSPLLDFGSDDIPLHQALPTTQANSLQVSGTGCHPDDFVWQNETKSTPGKVNVDQIFACTLPPSQEPSQQPSPKPSQSPSAMPSSAPTKCFFDTTTELKAAVQKYISDPSSNSVVAQKYGWPIRTWCTIYITSMASLFYTLAFNYDISDWDTSRVTTMGSLFRNSPFNQPILKWDTSKVTDMQYMFANTPFNQDLSSWNTSKLRNTYLMFHNSTFNQDLSKWDVARLTSMYGMFDRTTRFNKDLSSWGGKLSRFKKCRVCILQCECF